MESRLRSADVRHFARRGAPAVMASRTALIEEGAVESVHAKLIADRAPPQVGLVVGKRGVGARDLILALVPFPDWNAEKGDGDGDGAASQPSRPASGGTPLHIDVDSIVEHATQVTRMLPGGLDVVGAYAFAAEQAWRSASGVLARAVVEAAEAAARGTSRAFEEETNQTEQFLLHLSAEDKSKTSLRRVDRSTTGRPFVSLPPAESREGKALFGAGVVRLDAEHAFEWSVVLPSRRTTKKGTEKQHTLRSLLDRACALEMARVTQSEILVEDATWDDDVAVGAVPRRKRNGARVDEDQDRRNADDETDETDEPDFSTDSSTANVFVLRAELLAPPLSSVSGDVSCDSREKNAVASDADPSSPSRLDDEPSLRVTFKGVVSARAYSSARENVSEASRDLRRDVARSLRSRLDAFLDRADDALENERASANDNALSLLERRFFASEGLDGSGDPFIFADRLADAIKARRAMNDGTVNDVTLTLALPRRAWAEWRGGLAVCDYLADSETEADVVARCAEVMRLDVAGGCAGVLVAEREGWGDESFLVSGGGVSFSGANGTDDKRASNAEGVSANPPGRTSGTKPTSSSSSYAAYVLGAGVALVSVGLANLAMTSPEIAECVGEMCERAAEVARGAP